jgi:hypothetical protein
VLLSADDAAQVARVAARRRADETRAAPPDDGAAVTSGAMAAVAIAVEETAVQQAALAEEPLVVMSAGWRGEWGTADRIAVGLAAACLGLMMAAPALMGGTMSDAIAVMLAELHPLPR